MKDEDEDPARGFRATLMLADYATADGGKLTVVGGGWTVRGAQPGPGAIAGTIEVPPALANRQHQLRFELIDFDGQPVHVETPDGEQPLVIEGQFDVTRTPGMPIGAPLTCPIAINLAHFPLPPGGRFVWRYEIDGIANEDWRLAFVTQPDAQSFAA